MSGAKDNVTLKTLTAYQLLQERENMCELFNVVDRSEIEKYVMDADRKKDIMDSMKKKLEEMHSAK